MASKEGWAHEQNHDRITLGKKQYRNMEEWSRPCATCKTSFSIFVRQNSTGINSNFGYRNCKDHRGNRVSVDGAVVDNAELETLRSANNIMKEELDGLYAEAKELRASLAKYELQPALVAQSEKKFPWGA